MNQVDRVVFLVAPVAVGLANLGIYSGYIVPALTGDDRLIYADFWANYGPTPMTALVGMMMHPWRVLGQTLTSRFIGTVALPHLVLLPVIGWRWTLGIVPIVVVYSASADRQLRAFGVYYSSVLVPFLVIGASMGALTLARRVIPEVRWAPLAAAVLILMGALLVGSGTRGYSLRPWKAEIAAVPDALAQLADERVVLVQSGLYPHAGYDTRIQLLTPDTLRSPQYAGAAVLMARTVGAFPFRIDELDGLSRLPPICAMPSGLLAVRRPEGPVP